MDDSAQATAIAAALPDPPPFYQYFTSSNLKTFNSLRAAHKLHESSDTVSSPSRHLQDLSPELRYLLPPEPPSATEGNFRCFGDVYYVKEDLPSLQDMGVEQVYTPPSSPSDSQTPSQATLVHHDRAFILKRLAKSLLLNFLELVGILATNSSQWSEKVQDIRTLSINFHHLLNEYRPHQARETLILMLREQLDCRRAEIRAVRECHERVQKAFEKLETINLIEDPVRDDDSEIVDDLYVFEALEKEFG